MKKRVQTVTCTDTNFSGPDSPKTQRKWVLSQESASAHTAPTLPGRPQAEKPAPWQTSQQFLQALSPASTPTNTPADLSLKTERMIFSGS